VVVADVCRRLDDLPELRPHAESFDCVLANPPYNPERVGTVSVDALKAAANVMPGGNLARWARFMAAMTKPGGTATIIHRADALGEVLSAFAGRFGGAIVFPLHPRADASAIRVLVQGVKGSNAPIELRPGLVLHTAGNTFTPEAEAILRHGAALALSGPGAKRSRKRAT
jgi:tRNA1(Val) A37 N6-methylase TrmN6